MWTPKGRTKSVHISEVSTVVKLTWLFGADSSKTHGGDPEQTNNQTNNQTNGQKTQIIV